MVRTNLLKVNTVYEILQMMPDVLTEYTKFNNACKDDLESKNKKKRKHADFDACNNMTSL